MFCCDPDLTTCFLTKTGWNFNYVSIYLNHSTSHLLLPWAFSPALHPRQVMLYFFHKGYFFYWRAPQQMLRTHRSLEGLLCNPVRKVMRFFLFFLVMEHRWNEIDRGKPKYSGKNLSQCHFVHHKSHMDRPGIEPGPPRWKASDKDSLL
jgi:hypothetical protein